MKFFWILLSFIFISISHAQVSSISDGEDLDAVRIKLNEVITVLNAISPAAGVFQPESESQTINNGVLTVTKSIVVVSAQSGVTDSIDRIEGLTTNNSYVILIPATGHSITLNDGTVGSDNLDMAGQNVLLDSINKTFTIRHNGSYWNPASNSFNMLSVQVTSSVTEKVWEPDIKQGISDSFIIKYFPAEEYPNGVTIRHIQVAAGSTYTSQTFTFEDWDSVNDASPVTIEAVTVTSNTVGEDDGTIDSATILPDHYVAVNMPNAPEDVPYVTFTIVFTVE